MEDKIIVAVCAHPELYDSSCFHYRDRTQKEQAWRMVSEKVGVSEDICRRKWKGLRDTYLRDRKKEQEKKSGSVAGPLKRWKYSAGLSFLDPFVSPRENTSSSSNIGHGVEEDLAAEDSDAGMAQEAAPPEAAGPSVDTGDEPDLSGEVEQEAPAATPAKRPPVGRRRGKKNAAGNVKEREIEEHLLHLLRQRANSAPALPPSEDELFFKSLVPSLQRLPTHQKEHVKFQIHKLIYDATTVTLNF
ncbi:transcription factor Adf-1-like isoform X2 [Phyllopteryx taeniolatus]|uniref:transcription factor Adf-1-like isoform X2 n=1 Tax=Phyllopteryx taeniolatus TaxID=161469 RepID=UPI002AD406DC|nr:transcription factor Adf-1-like isoform X2 [Phyllopteryx taeniolatus]